MRSALPNTALQRAEDRELPPSLNTVSKEVCVIEELMRFQQLRPLQTISEEQASLLGLTLYPKQTLTAFAKNLVDAADRNSYSALRASSRHTWKAKTMGADAPPASAMQIVLCPPPAAKGESVL